MLEILREARAVFPLGTVPFVTLAAILGALLLGGAAYLVDRSVRIKSQTSSVGPTINIGEGSVVSVNQQGGITANEVNIRQEVAKPKFQMQEVRLNRPSGEIFESRFRLSITSAFAIPDVYLRVIAPSVLSLDAVPQRGALVFGGPSGNGKGYAFVTLINAYGDYNVRVMSSSPETFEFEYKY